MNQKEKNGQMATWKSILKSGKTDQINESIEKLRAEGSMEIIPDLAALLENPPSVKTGELAYQFLCDLQEQSCVAPLVEYLSQHKDSGNLARIVSTCWQNRLDFSAYLYFFSELVIHSDYATSVEAFSVVEENIEQLSLADRQKLLKFLEKEILHATPRKTALVKELISVVSPVSGPFSLDTESRE